MPIIYILIIDDTTNGEQSLDLQVFYELGSANARLVELKNDFIASNHLDDNDFEITDDCINEDDDILFSFCIQEKGDYNHNHYKLNVW